MVLAPGGNVALKIGSLSKTFGVTRALENVSFEVKRGQIHSLLGGNGSGKSTLIKVLAGVHRGEPGGSIDLLGTTIASDAMTPKLARECGLRFVHQNPAVFQSMTVAENMALGNAFPTRAGMVRWRELRRRTKEILERFDIMASPDAEMSTLRQADQTMVAIARALQDDDGHSVAALVLDEPTASLPDHEVGVLLKAVRRFAGQGHTILYVSHRLEEVLQSSDAVTVLRDGRHAVTRPTAGMTEDDLIGHIVGRPLRRERMVTAHRDACQDAPALEVAGLRGGPLRGVSFAVARGEVLGIAGLLGSGRTELLQMIFGAQPREGGDIRIEGTPACFRRVQDAIERGVAYVPEHRDREGVFQGLTVRDNLSMANVAQYWNGWRFHHRQERRDASETIGRFAIKTKADRDLISSLSGGNQQKVVLARWLRRRPLLLLLDEPTQGVDVGAREELYAAVRREVALGMAVVVVSSDFEELVQLCDRVAVLRQGRIGEELRGASIDRHRLTEAVLQITEQAA